MRIIVILILVFIIWTQGIDRLLGEIEFMKFKTVASTVEAEKHLVKALRYDPDSSYYQIEAAFFYFYTNKRIEANNLTNKVIATHNGDLTPYSYWYFKALLDATIRDRKATLYDLNKSLYYNPNYKESIEALRQIHEPTN